MGESGVAYDPKLSDGGAWRGAARAERWNAKQRQNSNGASDEGSSRRDTRIRSLQRIAGLLVMLFDVFTQFGFETSGDGIRINGLEYVSLGVAFLFEAGEDTA